MKQTLPTTDAHVAISDTPLGDHAQRPPNSWRRAAARTFFLVFASVLFIDTAPSTWTWMRPTKQFVSPALNYCGLWQGNWTLFAPNPILNNAWLSAVIYRPDGTQQEVWNSTYWANASGWERFVGFRRMNYRNRMAAIDPRAANDFTDYLARQLISPTAHPVNDQPSATATQPDEPSQLSESTPSTLPWRIVLSRNQLNLVLPDDGPLPKRDETMWISSSKNLAVREYQP
ncbi:MAG: hypothetical protein KDA72_20820 [Planctomycetales bacterium]|nr:hypothetical protein [Planctomycetales bacterium]